MFQETDNATALSLIVKLAESCPKEDTIVVSHNLNWLDYELESTIKSERLTVGRSIIYKPDFFIDEETGARSFKNRSIDTLPLVVRLDDPNDLS